MAPFVTSRCVSMATTALESPVQCGVRVGTSVAVGVLCVYVSFVCVFHADNEKCRETAPGAASSPLGQLPCHYISMFTCALSFLIQQCLRGWRVEAGSFPERPLIRAQGSLGIFVVVFARVGISQTYTQPYSWKGSDLPRRVTVKQQVLGLFPRQEWFSMNRKKINVEFTMAGSEREIFFF